MGIKWEAEAIPDCPVHLLPLWLSLSLFKSVLFACTTVNPFVCAVLVLLWMPLAYCCYGGPLVKNLPESRVPVRVLLQWLASWLGMRNGNPTDETSPQQCKPSTSGGNERKEKVNEWMCEAGWSGDPHTVSLTHCLTADLLMQQATIPPRLVITGFQEGQSGRIGCEQGIECEEELQGTAVKELGWCEGWKRGWIGEEISEAIWLCIVKKNISWKILNGGLFSHRIEGRRKRHEN